jgi:transcriptional regulator GlxA family with amidase domain
MPRNVAILVFDDVEVLDFAGPFEIFSVTGLRGDGEPPFNVYTVAEKSGVIAARNKLIVTPHYTIDNCPRPDVIVIPGGFGAHRGPRAAMRNPAILDWVRRQHAHTELTLSVCTGALVLATLGLLDGLQSTTHYGSYELLRETAPDTAVMRGVRYVDNGKVITSAGVQAGMDMALHVVARLLGAEAAAETAHYIEYDWQPRKVPSVERSGPMARPEDPVQRQLDAYNARDLERFVAEYTDDVQVFRRYASEPILSGKKAFGEHYAENRFTLPALHAALVNRIVCGNIVVDHERITGLPAGDVAAVAVYEVVGDRIRTVWFF